MTVLLTWRGTVLCRHRTSGTLVQRPITGSFDDATPVDLLLPAATLQVGFADHLRDDTVLARDLAAGPLRGWRIVRAADGRSVNLGRDGVFLSAIHESEAVEPVSLPRDWEAFLPVSDTDFEVLRQIARTDWLIRSSGHRVPADAIRFAPFHSLNLGPLSVDLRWQLPFDLAAWPDRLTVLRDGWRIEQICRFRPLVFFTAFGDEAILAQLALSVRSLVTFGRYDGDIAILTDRSDDAIARLLPTLDGARIIVLRSDPRDRMAYMASRYAIADWPGAPAYQPLLYVDTDTIFDADITPMLEAIACSDRMAAPVEPASPLRSWAPVGSGLLALDGCDPGFVHGFNSGTIGIPNVAGHAATLRLIGRIIANHALLKGRDALPHGDQEVANYVAFRTGTFDTALLSPFVRVGGVGGVAPDRRRGLVHFWGVPGAAARVQAMDAYLAALQRLG